MRIVALLEGLSLLVLLFIAMPLKYIWNSPEMVQVTGMIHGVLFIGYSLILLAVGLKVKWTAKPLIVSFAASFVPFGTFYADKKYFRRKTV